MDLKKKITKILPEYAILPIILMLALNVFTYNGTRLFTKGLYHYDLTLPIDRATPFIPPVFIAIYFLAYVHWILGFWLIAKESKQICYRFITAEMIAKTLTLICFFVIPTTNVRPEVVGDDIWSIITRILYKMESADNLFPSIHCLESWLCFRGALYLKKPGKWYKWVVLVCALSVFASTVFLKQHVVLDIAGAIVVVEIGILVSGLIFRGDKKTLAEGIN